MSAVTKQEIIDALRDASSYAFYRDLSELADRIEKYGIALPSIDALIAEAVAKEREACARVAESFYYYIRQYTTDVPDIEQAIRARGQK